MNLSSDVSPMGSISSYLKAVNDGKRIDVLASYLALMRTMGVDREEAERRTMDHPLRDAYEWTPAEIAAAVEKRFGKEAK